GAGGRRGSRPAGRPDRPAGRRGAGADGSAMSGSAGHLLVRAGGRLVGLPLDQVVEVLDPGATFPVPSLEPAVRGVAVVRGRILPLIHLGALLDGGECPPERSDTGVMVDLAGLRLC